jgi:hypothetical protein
LAELTQVMGKAKKTDFGGSIADRRLAVLFHVGWLVVESLISLIPRVRSNLVLPCLMRPRTNEEQKAPVAYVRLPSGCRVAAGGKDQ